MASLQPCSHGRLWTWALMAQLLFCGAATGQEIRIGGTGNALGTMRKLGDAYMQSHAGAKVTVLNSLGSNGAIKAVSKGALDIGLASRSLSAEELAEGGVATEYARTATVFTVAAKSPVTAITRQQIIDIYLGTLKLWPDGTPIRLVVRQLGDDNTRQIRGLSADIDKAISASEVRPGLVHAMTDQDTADSIETIPGAIGVTTLALIRSEGRSLRALKLDGVDPTPQRAAAGEYPIVKRFFLITRTASSTNVVKFIEFVQSPQGRAILAQTGHWMP